MAYGVQLFDADGNELVGRFVPTFIIDYITSPASGSRSYPSVQGKTLRVYPLQYIGDGARYGTPNANASVSGNTVTWSSVSASVPIMIVYE